MSITMAVWLLGRRLLSLTLEQQRMLENIGVSVDGDFAADRATRQSTAGMVQGFGRHPILKNRTCKCQFVSM